MPRHRLSLRRRQQLNLLLGFVILRNGERLEMGWELTPNEEEEEFLVDCATYWALRNIRYLAPRNRIPRAGSLHILWDYAQAEHLHSRFKRLVHVTPATFIHILDEIEDHSIFCNQSNHPQAPVENQLAIALHRLGRSGNAASIDDLALIDGVGHGTIALYTTRVITALLSKHAQYVRSLTRNERMRERDWVLRRIGCPEFAAGIFQYDGSTIPLWQKPGLNGDAYFSRHFLYELNLQVGCVGSNLRIVDYCVGYTGSAHDALAFRSTAAYSHPELVFQGDEFAWTDSAYPVSYRIIPIHKAPANQDPMIRAFDRAVSYLRVRSEHCNGLLKGLWQSLRGLRISINRRRDHIAAMKWVSACVVLHNICIEMGEDNEVRQEEPIGDFHEENAEYQEAAAGDRRRLLVDAYNRYRNAAN